MVAISYRRLDRSEGTCAFDGLPVARTKNIEPSLGFACWTDLAEHWGAEMVFRGGSIANR